jgi:ankyrin repeat protein
MDAEKQQVPESPQGKKKMNWFKKEKDGDTKSNVFRRPSLSSLSDLIHSSSVGKSQSITSLISKNSSGSDMNISRKPPVELFTSYRLELLKDSPKIHPKRLPSLHKAVYTSNYRKLKLILTGPCVIDEMDPHGLTALHIATEMGNTQMVRELLGQDGSIDGKDFLPANPNIADSSGRTPLMLVYCVRI